MFQRQTATLATALGLSVAMLATLLGDAAPALRAGAVGAAALAVGALLWRGVPAASQIAATILAVALLAPAAPDAEIVGPAALAAAVMVGLLLSGDTVVLTAALLLAGAYASGLLPELRAGIATTGESVTAVLLLVCIPGVALVSARVRSRRAQGYESTDLAQTLTDATIRVAAAGSTAALHRALVDGARAIVGPRSAVLVVSADGSRSLAASLPDLEGQQVDVPAAMRPAFTSSGPVHLLGAEAASAARHLRLPAAPHVLAVGVGREPVAAAVVLAASDLPTATARAVVALAGAGGQVAARMICSDDLQPSDARYSGVVQDAPDVLMTADLSGRVTFVNPAIHSVLGFEPSEVVGAALADFTKPDMAGRLRALLLMAADSGLSTGRIRLRHADGSWRHCEVRGSRLQHGCGPECSMHDGDGVQVIVTIRDVTERAALEEDLAHRAFHDSLTDLPNRALLADRVDQALRATQRTGKQVAVLFCDLDDFKTINDTLGHQVGDQLLVEMASRLRECIRPGDTGARLGGDEFAVLLENVSAPQEAEQVARRLLNALGRPVQLGRGHHVIGASIGVAVAGAGESASDVLRKADIAMYVAKRRGKHRFEMFREDAADGSLERLQRLAELQGALEREEFVAHYQPTIDLATGTIVGVEALVRWQHPTHGLLGPSEFIPLAEDSGLIVAIGRWVLREACRQVSAWQSEFGPRAPREVSVNLSVVQLARDDLVVEVAEALDGTRLSNGGLTLEITESGLMTDMAMSTRRLSALKRLGVNLAVDDFGTGYSSLAYLQQFPIDTLKIDRTFVDGVDGSPESSALAKAIVRLGRELNLRTVAEGIERPSQVEALRRLRCPVGQGFYFSEPLTAADVEGLLREA